MAALIDGEISTLKTTRRILAIDPGLKTGMCVFTHVLEEEPVLVWAKELDEEEFAMPVRWELENHPELEIACEKFTITVATAKKSPQPYSMELIGVVKQSLRDIGRDPKTDPKFKLQLPTDAMSLFPNPALKKLGYWHRGGEGHALDSIRHGLLYLAKTGWKPIRLLQD